MHKCRKCNGRITYSGSFFHWFHVGISAQEFCPMNPPEPACSHNCIDGKIDGKICPIHPQAHEAIYGKKRKPRKKKIVVVSKVEGFDYLEEERG